jgi:hypothetical protein
MVGERPVTIKSQITLILGSMATPVTENGFLALKHENIQNGIIQSVSLLL